MAKKITKKKTEYWQAVGRRKTAAAVVRLYRGSGQKILVNDKSPDEYFGKKTASLIFLKPLAVCDLLGKFDLTARIKGGGKIAQIEAVRLGIARALVKYDQKLRPTLRREEFLTRDPREKERKKPGLKRARRAPQWQKR